MSDINGRSTYVSQVAKSFLTASAGFRIVQIYMLRLVTILMSVCFAIGSVQPF